ncbi:MAG: hypothetical protein IIA90_09395, partial [Chloroflexi bacterium]|nr:hypothetical protein [Chloroflexota bacterium]
ANEPALRIQAGLVSQVRGWLWVALMTAAGEKDAQAIAKAAGFGNPKRVYVLQRQVRGCRPQRLQQLLLQREERLFHARPRALHGEDGFVDCLDLRPFLTASIGKADVRPAETVSVPLDIAAWWPGVTAYEIHVSFEPAVVEAVSCRPREETVCVVEDGLVTVFGSPSSPLSGHFRPAYIDFEASGNVNTFSSLHLAVEALSARVPDIGLQLFTEDGSVRISDPGPTLVGDLDCDSKVGPDDVIDVLRAASGSSESLCLAQGDVNCSGAVDAFDGLALIAYIAEIAQPSLVGCPEIGSSLAPEAEEPE